MQIVHLSPGGATVTNPRDARQALEKIVFVEQKLMARIPDGGLVFFKPEQLGQRIGSVHGHAGPVEKLFGAECIRKPDVFFRRSCIHPEDGVPQRPAFSVNRDYRFTLHRKRHRPGRIRLALAYCFGE